MAVKQLILIPIYWGDWWMPIRGNAYNWADVNGPMAKVVTGRYADGLIEYGYGRGTVSKTYLLHVDPPAGGLGDVLLRRTLRSAIDAGHVAGPDEFDLAEQQPCYALILAPDPERDSVVTAQFEFDYDYGDGRDPWVGRASWVRGDVTAAGTVRRLARELAAVCTEGHGEVADRCRDGQPVFVDRVSVPQYWSVAHNACWPPPDVAPVERRSQHAIDRETQRLLDAQFEQQFSGAWPVEGRAGLHRREDDPA
ncbi:MAG: hypothetical protein DLM59_20405 [Pseudonocardiales bacterium]|nr:MAG: hypothetical protein DLM59_20405 [Pseudonocardiales bacterium]